MKAPVPGLASTWHLAPFRGEALEGLEGAVATAILPDPFATARAGRVVRSHRHRLAARVSLPAAGPALLKVQQGDEGWRAVLGPLREPRVKREWRAARYLAGLGVPVAPAWAYGVKRRLWTLRMAFFAARFEEQRVSLREALTGQPPREATALLQRAGRLVGGLLDRGFVHDDLHPGNILVGRGPGSLAPLLVTDLHRVRLGTVVTPRVRSLVIARLLHGLIGTVGPAGRQRVLRAAWGEALSKNELREAQTRVARDMQRLERRRRASRTRRCLLESGQFTRALPRPWVGVRRRSLSDERIAELVREHDDALRARDRRILKDGRKSRITCHGDVVVKESLDSGLGGRLRTRLAPSRHRRGYVGARRLEVAGVGTARPLAWMRAAGRHLKDLSPFPRLDHVVRRLARAGSRDALRRLLDASADHMARLHAMGVYHGDLKGANVLVDDRVRPPRFHLVDTDSVRLMARPVDAARRWKNLAQLAASIPVSVTRTDRLRWWRRYASSWPVVGDARTREREAAHRVGRLLARKILVVDEPIE